MLRVARHPRNITARALPAYSDFAGLKRRLVAGVGAERDLVPALLAVHAAGRRVADRAIDLHEVLETIEGHDGNEARCSPEC